jgi:hypothetical protein
MERPRLLRSGADAYYLVASTGGPDRVYRIAGATAYHVQRADGAEFDTIHGLACGASDVWVLASDALDKTSLWRRNAGTNQLEHYTDLGGLGALSPCALVDLGEVAAFVVAEHYFVRLDVTSPGQVPEVGTSGAIAAGCVVDELFAFHGHALFAADHATNGVEPWRWSAQ